MSQAGLVDLEQGHPQIPTQFDTDSGTAIPIDNTIEILGETVPNATNATPVFTTGSGNTVTIEVQVGAAIIGAPADSNDAGLASFDDSQFSVDEFGFVQLKGGTVALDTITGDDAVEVTADGNGNMNFTGVIVPNATNPKPLYFDGDSATFTQELELQVSGSSASPPANTNSAGICSFSSSQFNVNANGYVELIGSSQAIDSNTGDDGITVLPDVNGNFNWIGNAVDNGDNAKPVFFKDSTTANAIDLDVQVSVAITGAPADKNDAGLASFDDENFTCDTNGYTALIDGENVLFVGKWGDDSHDGLNFEAAKLTITAALSAATSGTTIHIYPGTYTEDFTLKAGISLNGFLGNNGDNGTTVIVGKITFTEAGSSAINGIFLYTNSDYAIEMTGSNSCILRITTSRLRAANNTIINLTNSS